MKLCSKIIEICHEKDQKGVLGEVLLAAVKGSIQLSTIAKLEEIYEKQIGQTWKSIREIID